MSIMNSAAAMHKDGYFFENAILAWQQAKESWQRYGERELPTSVGFNIRLNDKEPVDQRIKDAREELARLCPGAEEQIRQEKLSKLSPEKRAVMNMRPEDRSPEQYSLAYEADQETKVVPRDFLNRSAKREDRPRVRQLVDQIEQDEVTTHQIDLNRRIVNFEYWRTRAESELTEEAPKAHSGVYEADKLKASGENLAKARGLYEDAWKLYASIFERYPALMDNAEAQDLIESVAHYRDLLGQLDEPFPQSFPLWPLMDKHQKGQQIRDQVKILQGSEATTPQPQDTNKSESPRENTADPKPADTKSDSEAPREKSDKAK
jgi:hypothetical protein